MLYLFFFQIDRNSTQLSSNAASVLTEIEEMHTRLTNVLKERTEFLKSSVDKYLIVESKTLKDLKENLELELANIKVNELRVQSNADLHKGWCKKKCTIPKISYLVKYFAIFTQ